MHWKSQFSVALKSLAVSLCLFGAQSLAGTHDAAHPNATQCIRIEVFGRKGSAQSDAAAKFVTELAEKRVGVAVEIKDISADRAAEARARDLLKKYRVAKPGLPVIHACEQLIVGYNDDASTGRRIEDLLTIHAYVREGCPHCAAAKAFLRRIGPSYPGFTIQYHDIVAQPAERDRLLEIAKRLNVQVANVPGIYVCGRLLVGYDTDATSGRRLEEVLKAACVPCPKQPLPEAGSDGNQRKQETGGPFVPGAILLGVPALFRQTTPAEDASTATREDVAPLEDLEDLEDMGEAESYSAPPSTAETTSDVVDLPLFGSVSARQVGLPLFTIAIGLVDGFNPCAMWVLLFLLSILVNLHSRWKILAVAGTFVVISGLAYFAFMAAWLNVFQIVGFFRPAQIALGLLAVFIGSVHVKDFFAFHEGFSLSIPEAAKPGIYARVRRIVTAENLFGAVLGAACLAVLVNVVELLCTAGLPALYTQILTLRGLPAWKDYAYLALYNAAYMADDTLMVAVVVITLGKRKMQETQGRWLKLVSGVAVLALGLLLLFKPEWLI
jgi:glutaredoxin